jgi:aryl-alcohol dehydrogenase-like predicted oxidoreductase
MGMDAGNGQHLGWAVRRGVGQTLQRLRTDYLDVFHILWIATAPRNERELAKNLAQCSAVRWIRKILAFMTRWGEAARARFRRFL